MIPIYVKGLLSEHHCHQASVRENCKPADCIVTGMVTKQSCQFFSKINSNW